VQAAPRERRSSQAHSINGGRTAINIGGTTAINIGGMTARTIGGRTAAIPMPTGAGARRGQASSHRHRRIGTGTPGTVPDIRIAESDPGHRRRA
jgi:hypothetical protein